MKKLITGAVATLALLFGFASCSGDLHDSVVSKLYAEGDFCTEKVGNNNVRLPFVMTKGSDTEQKCEFKYDASKMTAWGGGSGTLNFKITRDEWGWAKDWGGKKDIAVELSVNSQEWLDLEGRDAVNSNPGNIVLKDLADGNTYTLIAKYDAPSEKLSLKCVGAVTDYPILKAVITDDSEGSELTAALSKEVILTRTGTSYSSDVFVPTKDGSVSYYLTNGYLYWGADGKMSTSKPTDENKIEGEWTYNSNFPTWGRKIFVSAINFTAATSETDPTPKKELTSDVRIHDTTILSDAGLVGSDFGWTGSTKLIKDDDTTYHYDFTANSEDQTFSIQKTAGSWAARWCGQKNEKDDKGDWKKSEYITLKAGDSEGIAGTSASLFYITGGDPEHTHMTLLKDSKYRLTFRITGDNAVSAELTLIKKVEKQIIDLTGYGARGLFGEWGEASVPDAVKFTKQTDGKYTLEFTAIAATSDCKIANSGWTAYPLDSSGSCQNFAADGKEYSFYKGDSGFSNPQLTGMEIGSSYIMTVTPTTDCIKVKVTRK